jgi:hypothetical protein
VIFQRTDFVDRLSTLSCFITVQNTSINVISNFNNIGDVPFSRDYFRLTGGSRNTIGRNGTNFINAWNFYPGMIAKSQNIGVWSNQYAQKMSKNCIELANTFYPKHKRRIFQPNLR